MKIYEGPEFHQKLEELLEDGVTIYSIYILKEDDDTYDLSIWDEVENGRAEDLEEGHSYIESYEEAKKHLQQVVSENPHITFLRLEDR